MKTVGLDRIQVALRSKNVYGSYKQNVAIRDTTHGITFGIHQGALIKTQKGEWWTMLFVANFIATSLQGTKPTRSVILTKRH